MTGFLGTKKTKTNETQEGLVLDSFWSPERVELLSTQWCIGATSSQIADLLGTTRSAIMGKVSRLRKRDRLAGGSRAIIVAARKPQQRKGRRKPFIIKKGPSKPPRAVLPPPVIAGGVPLLDLTLSQCRAIIGHDGYLARFCGAETTIRVLRGQAKISSYCAGHHAQYHQVTYGQ